MHSPARCAVTVFALLAVVPRVLAATVYVAGSGGQFGWFDLSTRAYTQISGNALAGVSTTGIAYHAAADMLYLNDRQGNLRAVDPETGVSTTVAVIDFHGAAADTIGLTVDSIGTLRTYNYGNDAIFAISPVTGNGTQIGNSGFSSDGPLSGKLALLGSTLYGAMSVNLPAADGLYTFNTTSGAAVFVGNGGSEANYVNMITFTDGSLLYGVNGTNLYQIETATGSLTSLGALSGDNLPAAFSGAVIAPAQVPEPAVPLLGIVAISAGLWRRTRSSF